MSREESYEQAAICYRRAGRYDLDAARCYQLAGAHRRAAEIYETAGELSGAARAFADAGLPELGAWLLAHKADRPAEARALLSVSRLDRGSDAGPGTGPTPSLLRRHLVIARCELAEGEGAAAIRPVIAEVCAALGDRNVRPDQVTEEWAVALSETAARYDQAALVFAAAVRGGRYGAEHRWKTWSARVLGAEVILPPPPPPTLATAATMTAV
jgi:hypothetical protein